MCGIIGLVPSEHSYFNNFCAASCKFPCHEKSESLQRGGGDWSKGLVTCKGIGQRSKYWKNAKNQVSDCWRREVQI